MIGLDTNVIIRFVTQDDPRQSAAANTLFQSLTSAAPGHVSIVSLVETVWVLQRGYRLSREQIGNVVDSMMHSRELSIDRKSDVVAALEIYRHGTADFADCLIDRISRAQGCTRVVTFDHKAAKATGMELLSTSAEAAH